MLNVVVLTGRICNELELRNTSSNIPVLSFKVAVDRKYKAGEDKQTDFINIVAWRSIAEFTVRYFAKGDLIGIEGSIQSRKYQDKDGNNREIFEILANNVHFVGGKRENKTEAAALPAAPAPGSIAQELQQHRAKKEKLYEEKQIDYFTEMQDEIGQDLPF